MVDILKSMLGRDSEDEDLCKNFDDKRSYFGKQSPRVRCAFGNVCIYQRCDCREDVSVKLEIHDWWTWLGC